MFIKLLHLSITILFIAFAVVQYNDPDGWRWVLLYLAVAILPIIRLIKVSAKSITIGLSIAFLLALVYNADQLTQWISAGRPAFIDYEPTTIREVEGIREYLGICIAAVTVWFYLLIELMFPLSKSKSKV